VRPLALLAGYGLDRLFGDPERGHPVAAFGLAAQVAERVTQAPSRRRGALVALGLAGGAMGMGVISSATLGRTLTLAATTWAAIGGRSLEHEAAAVEALVAKGDLTRARERLRSLCGRDAAALDEAAIRRAVIESVAENTADAVVGPLLWGALLGAPGAALYRAANTLDAMWGRKDDRYREFGWAAARLDDLLNLPVSRLAAVLAVALAPAVGGTPGEALDVWLDEGGAHPSPNAGQVEAAFAGALGVELGGPLAYAGIAEDRPTFNQRGAAELSSEDVHRAIQLSNLVGSAAALSCAALAWKATR
jgi:adenosylcobinamide-phosphate synthase